MDNSFKQPNDQSIDVAETTNPITTFTNMLFQIPLTNETKIQFLKEELSAGRYEVRSQSLAEKLMEHTYPLEELEEMA